mmetsp:Transcript_34544/g.90401  ORF Transcript_34544/g.90401 Transcript_34544/m.90401 type:complete len:242 (-) Transcript_34544:278-1003(-)
MPRKVLEGVAAKMSNLGIGRAGSMRQSSSVDSSADAMPPSTVSPDHPLFKGVCIVGNGRSVLSQSAGSVVDRFDTVLRFNDFQIPGYEEHVGSKTSVWVVSDWTIIKLLNKYPDRSLPVLCAIPFRFMGKPYYAARRGEVEKELTPAQRKRVTFISLETARNLIGGRNFGDRWPSSGLLTIMHMLEAQSHEHVFVHGFDFFKEIDGKIHYMEDTHTANHHAAEEERICLELMQQGQLRFVS